MKTMIVGCVALVAGMLLIGCSGRPSLLPNADPALRKNSAQFAADAAKRFPYKADAAKGGEARARAQVGYMLKKLEIVNLSDEDWTNVEVWVDQTYVVFLPTMEKGKLKTIEFPMLYDGEGNSFPVSKARVTKLEILRDGKMYNVALQLAD